MKRLTRLLGPSVATALATSVLVAGCSSDDGDPEAGPSPTATAATSATPYLPVPDRVTLTEPGSQLSVGDRAVVAYRPRQDQVGVLDIDVTKLQKTSIRDFSAWQLSAEQKKSTPYYVRVTIENVGDSDLGGRPVPLYVVNDDNVLLESTPFASSFGPCPSTPFPEKFRPGDKTDVCLVYLAPDHGELEAVSFRPEETFNPITWTGEVERYQPPKSDKGKDNGGKSGDNG